MKCQEYRHYVACFICLFDECHDRNTYFYNIQRTFMYNFIIEKFVNQHDIYFVVIHLTNAKRSLFLISLHSLMSLEMYTFVLISTLMFRQMRFHLNAGFWIVLWGSITFIFNEEWVIDRTFCKDIRRIVDSVWSHT